MGYLQIFGEKLDELMQSRGIGEAEREEIAAYVKETVLQSYRNGLEKGRAEISTGRSASRNAKPTRKGSARRTR
jgi:hypothetical protein